MKKLIYIFISIVLFSIGCKKNGFENQKNINQAPKTYMVVDSIYRSGNNRYNSQVKVHWWGNDADGFVKGYQISTDLVNWTYTLRQDSIFNLIIPAGKDTFDFPFYVKAVDDADLEDTHYATLYYPVKNSAPTVAFITPNNTPGVTTRNPIRSFPVLKYNWVANDPDGLQDIDHFEICLNDSSTFPISLPASINDITIVMTAPKSGSSSSDIYTGQSATPIAGITLSGMSTDRYNTLYIRAVDQVGSKSKYIAAEPIYVKRVKGDILLVNAIVSASQRSAVQSFYAQALADQGKGVFDTMQAVEIVNNNYTELSVDNLTQSRVFKLFKHMVWVTDDANYSLSFGQKVLGQFFKEGGTMLMSVAFASTWDTTASWLDFTPVRKLVSQMNGQTYRMIDQASITNTQTGWPTLTFATVGAPIVRPFFKFENNGSFNYEYLYNATIRVTGGGPSYDWKSADSTNVIAKRTSPAGVTNFIFSSVPLEKANGNANSIYQFFSKALIGELGF